MAIVDYLGIKFAHGHPMKSQRKISLMTGKGILDDVAANAKSPRQILVVRSEDREAFNLPPGYLRENISVRGLTPEALAPGRFLSFDTGAQIFLTFNCEPCRTIAGLVPKLKDITGKRGVLGVIIGEGDIQISSDCQPSVTCEWEPLSDRPSERILAVVKRIPTGRVIDYATLLVAAGLQGPYFRVMPKYISQAQQAGLPAHRVVDTSFNLPAVSADYRPLLEEELSSQGWHSAGLQEQLFEHPRGNSWIPRGAGWCPSALDLVKVIGET